MAIVREICNDISNWKARTADWNWDLLPPAESKYDTFRVSAKENRMNTRLLALGVGLMFSSPVFPQSTITLDSFDLGTSSQSELMRDCLFEEGKCDDAEFGGSVEITLSDVVNLGVVDRSEINETARSETGFETSPAEALPTIDLEILFTYNSDELSTEAYRKLSELSSALSDPRLRDQKLVFIGHTDAIGSAAYNFELSQRRAQSVAGFVRATMLIDRDRISAVGVGFSRLKNRFDPSAAENRRVQLVLVPIS